MDPPQDDTLPLDLAGYHQRTKHAPQRYALGPAFLDWESQPEAFRRFEGTRTIALPLRLAAPTPAFDTLDPPPAAPAGLDIAALGLFCELAFGISAWKTDGTATWAVRNNPSSGNLHPTEAYLILPDLAGIGPAGLYHYAPQPHALEERGIYPPAAAPTVAPGPQTGFALALSSVPWRESWKYGERAFRYCQLDVGHAIGCVAYAAAALGWSVRLLDHLADAELTALLGLARPDAGYRFEGEHPDCLLWIGPGPATLPAAPPDWRGRANRLSCDHDPWPLIDRVLRWTEKPATLQLAARTDAAPLAAVADHPAESRPPLGDVIRRRRSAQRMDGISTLSRADFIRILRASDPTRSVPFAAFPWAPAIDLLLFVHRVADLPPGLYLRARSDETAPALQAACGGDFAWAVIDLDGLRLYRLRTESYEREAARLACLQGIAGKGAFSIAMLARFAPILAAEGNWAYRRLYWEAGLIGQTLYLAATAAGVAGTGIGCFFDDSVHQLLGLPVGTAPLPDWQDLYHFTIGTPLDDPRVLTLPAYPDGR